MFQFFQGIFGKVAVGISTVLISIAGFISPQTEKMVEVPEATSTSVFTPYIQEPPQDIGANKIENKIVSSPVTVPTKTTQKEPIVKVAAADNFRENVVLMYSKSAESIKRNIDAFKIDLQDLYERRSHVSSLLNASRSINFSNSGDGVVLNEMFSILGDSYASEIKFIDDNTKYINSQISYLEQIRTAYSSAIDILLSNPTRVVSREEFIADAQQENNVTSENAYKAETNIFTALKNHYSNVIKKEDDYASAVTIIKSAIAKVTTPSTPVSSTYYQPMPQTDYGLTARQQLLLNPITCKVNYDPIQATVTCY